MSGGKVLPDAASPDFATVLPLRIFQRFRLVKFIEKLKTRVKNLKIEKIIAFDKPSPELFFVIFFTIMKVNFSREKIIKLLIDSLFYKMQLFLK